MIAMIGAELCSCAVLMPSVFFSASAPGGDLQTLMDDDMVPYERDAVKFVRQVLEGLLFLHERNMAHLDIKVKQTNNNNNK